MISVRRTLLISSLKTNLLLRIVSGQGLTSFYSALHPDGTNIRQEEYDLSILIRLSFRPSEIANLMQTTVSNVSANRRRLYTKLKKEQGSAKDFDDLVKGIY